MAKTVRESAKSLNDDAAKPASSRTKRP
jgi:hypothetical protein